jgi:hypothetical protein
MANAEKYQRARMINAVFEKIFGRLYEEDPDNFDLNTAVSVIAAELPGADSDEIAAALKGNDEPPPKRPPLEVIKGGKDETDR